MKDFFSARDLLRGRKDKLQSRRNNCLPYIQQRTRIQMYEELSKLNSKTI